jgi:hypothetical protein
LTPARQRTAGIAILRRRRVRLLRRLRERAMARIYDDEGTARILCLDCGQRRQGHSPYGHCWADPLDSLIEHIERVLLP